MKHHPQALSSGSSGAGALLASLLVTSFGANAQTESDSTGRRTVSVAPRISATETYTDNLYLSSAPTQSEWVTEISPGINIKYEGARLKAFIDYSLTGLAYAGDHELRRSQNALNAFGLLELVDKWLFVDFGGTISQQPISAFGTQAGTNTTAINGNQTEVADYRISPYVRGRLASVIDYEARVTLAGTRPESDSAPANTSTGATVKLTRGGNASGLAWSADLGQQNETYTDGRDTQARHFILELSKAFSPQFKLLANVGRESNNYTNIDQQTYATYSMGVKWEPSDVTKLSATVGQRYFGNAHDITFEHRSGRTVWMFSDVADDNTSDTRSGLSSQGSNYELLFRQFAAIEPDPIARATLVNNYLQKNGISTDMTSSSFLTSAVTLERRQSLSFALLGVRDSILFGASQTRSTRLDTLSTGVDDLTNSDLVRLQWLSVNYRHRLTPSTSFGVILSRQENSGSNSALDNRLQELHLNLTSKLGKQAAATVGVRRILYQSNVTPYAETALICNFTFQF